MFAALFAQLFAQLLAQLDADPLSLLNTQDDTAKQPRRPLHTAMQPIPSFGWEPDVKNLHYFIQIPFIISVSTGAEYPPPYPHLLPAYAFAYAFTYISIAETREQRGPERRMDRCVDRTVERAIGGTIRR